MYKQLLTSVLIMLISFLYSETVLAIDITDTTDTTLPSIAIGPIPFNRHIAPPPPAPPPMSKEQFATILHSLGVTVEQSNNNINIFFDLQTALLLVSKLQAVNQIDPKIGAREIDSHPVSYSTQVALFYATAILPYLYQTTKADQLHFNLYLVTDGGEDDSDTNNLFASFDTARKIYDTTDWNHFNARDLPKAVLNFKYSDWYQTNLDDKN
jgi:hypothetical protein